MGNRPNDTGLVEDCLDEAYEDVRPAAWQYVQVRLADIREIDDLPIEDRYKWFWIRMYADARAHDGRIAKENLHNRLKITPKTCEKTLEIFQKFGLILDHGAWFEPRYWASEQAAPRTKTLARSEGKAKSSTERSREFRARQRATCNGNATPRERERVILHDAAHHGLPPATHATRIGKTRLADDAELLGDDLRTALSLGIDDVDARTEFDLFRSHHVAAGTLMANWRAAWRAWLLRRERMGFRRTSEGRESNFTKAARELLAEYEREAKEDVFVKVAKQKLADMPEESGACYKIDEPAPQEEFFPYGSRH